ncbi:MAG: DUF6265 family protein [Balneola sp.]
MDKVITALLLLIGVSFSPVSETEIHKTEDFNIEDYQWLAGTWTGDSFGGISEESWSLPVDGTMMGMYRNYRDGKIVFYEFILLDETGMRLKHFNPDLTSWEEKNDMVHFPMISFSKTKIEMEGLIFELTSENQIRIQLQITQNDETHTEIISMKRVK